MKVTQFGPGSQPLALSGWSTGATSVNSNFNTVDGGFSATNFVQGITVNGSNMLLRPIANIAAGSNILLTVDSGPGGSIPSNTVRIHGQAGGGGGATISAGSNSTRVSEDSSAGASTTLWSPFDHRHDGIGTITSSSSNTMQRGTWNLRAGSGIALALTDTDGDGEFDTTTISTTSSGGGSGASGNVSTVAATTIDYGAAQLLKRRTAANTEDDMFDATSLDAKWLAYTGANASTDLTALVGWCKLTADGYKLQAVPGGDWTIEAEIIAAGRTVAAFQDCGLILTNGTTATSATDARYGIGNNNAEKDMRLIFEKFVNNAFNSTYVQWQSTSSYAPVDHLFLRINKNSTTYRIDWSTTGVTFGFIGTTSSLGFTPTHFGFGGTSGMFINYFVRY